MRRRAVDGFTLIEVLVALLVLAAGAVGAAALQASAQRTRQQSALMSAAVQLASSLAERMQANRAAADSYPGLDYDASGGPPEAPALACYGDANCSPPDLAAHDLHDIKQALYLGFPGGRVLVCRDALAASGLTWDCAPAADAPVVIKLGWRGKEAAGEFAPMVAIVAAEAS